MRGLAWKLLALFYTLATGLILSPAGSDEYADANNTVIISLSQEMFVDLPNRIILHSEKPIFKVIVNMNIQGLQSPSLGLTTFYPPIGSKSTESNRYIYDLKYYVPFELEPGSYFDLKITYLYCSATICRSGDKVMEESVDITVQMVQRFIVIMGETDKPHYRPGEQVRFRFIALTSRHLLPHSESPTWPTHQAVKEFWQSWRLTPIDTAQRDRRLQAPQFDSIVVRDPLINIVRQWKNVQPLDALGLEHKLMSDAEEGEWQIEVRVRDYTEVIYFIVEHYNLPRFLAHVELPTTIPLIKSDVAFNVCATYTNGPFLRGTFAAQICICDESALERQQKEKKMFAMNKESDLHANQRHLRRCQLREHHCEQVTGDARRSSKMERKIKPFVRVVEEDTGSSVFVPGVTEFRRWAEPRIVLKLPNTYRNGLPIVGQVVFRDSLNGADDKLEVAAGMETYDFIISPVNLQNPIFVAVRQVSVMNTSSVTCPGSVKLQVIANKALPHNTTLTLQFLSRGQLTTRTMKLEADYACVPQDNEFGHYECSDGDEIRCLEGWTGANCQTPVCAGDGCGRGGICVAPCRCVGKSGGEFMGRMEHRTFFRHKGNLKLDGAFGPELRDVAYVYNDGQMASDFVKIGGLLACSSLAMAATEQGGGLQFDKQLVVPEEKVNLSVAVSTENENKVVIANTCLLGVIDASSEYFDSANYSIIDFDAYVGLLTSNVVYKRDDAIKGTEDAFHMAGMEIIP
uniref:DSL domain-containing protein n=1 Tax=Echinococcus canadensis TaxID=519352 RepID=A0A915EY49_9CEST